MTTSTNHYELPKDVFKQATEEELQELICLSVCGVMHYDRESGDTVILMGSEAFNRYHNYKQELINKYGKIRTDKELACKA